MFSQICGKNKVKLLFFYDFQAENEIFFLFRILWFVFPAVQNAAGPPTFSSEALPKRHSVVSK
jgi:hypothetical protein